MFPNVTPHETLPATEMRKRKRNTGHGAYVDEDTGEVTTVQTNKQAKRAHQKSGKWYKEPTEAELRAWDRDEKRQALADRAAKKEENKRINAAKRVEKERRDEEVKKQMFQAGRITFTQTLAKKDEDQMNLHSWFGGRSKAPKSRNVSPACVSDVACGDKRGQSENKDNVTDITNDILNPDITLDDETSFDQVRKLSQDGTNDFGDEIELEDFVACGIDHLPKDNRNPETDQAVNPAAMDLQTDQLIDPAFEVLEDESAETVIPDQDLRQTMVHHFKIPPLPNHAQQQSPQRLPLSPMSPSDVNVRNFQTSVHVSSFKARLETAKIEVTPSTQAIRDILSGICTQDLADDLDEINKENDEPDTDDQNSGIALPIKSTKHSDSLKEVSPIKVDSVPVNLNESFNSNADSVDYDSIFFELDLAQKGKNDENGGNDDDFDDCGLDDATLLSLPPATQLITFAHESGSSANSSFVPNLAPSKATSRTFIKSESFALEGLEDDDLLAEFNEYERSQNKTVSTSDSTSRKKRILPWDRPDWSTEVHSPGQRLNQGDTGEDGNELNDGDDDMEVGTQDTEVISTFGY